MMSKIVNRPSEAVQHKPHEDVAAEVCTDASMLNDKELDAATGGYGGGGSTGKVQFQDFHFTKRCD